MVAAYVLSPLTHMIAKRLVTAKHFALPNILNGAPLIPEFIQDKATPDNLADAVLALMEEGDKRAGIIQDFNRLHQTLLGGGAKTAAEAIYSLHEAR